MNTDLTKERASSSNKVSSVKTSPFTRFKNFMSILISNRAALVGLIIIVVIVIVAILESIFGKLMLPYDSYTGELSNSLQSPSAAHFFGTDEQGRDIFSRVIDGTKISLRVGIISVAIALSIGTVVGSACGYFGGKLDMLLMRIMDIILAFPSLLLAIA